MIKCVVKFSGVSGSKWAEMFFFSGSFDRTAQPFGPSLQTARLNFLDNQSYLKSIRYSNPDSATRASSIYEFQSKGFYPSDGENAALPGLAAVWTLTSTNPLASRKVWLHGLNEKQFGVNTQTGNPEITDEARGLMGAFCAAVANNGGSIRCLKRNVTLGNGLFQVLKAEMDVDNFANTRLTTKGSHGFTVPVNVLIRGADRKTAPGLNGTFKLLAQTATTLTINYQMPTQTVQFSPGCFVRTAEYETSCPIDGVGFHSLSVRKVQESFFGSRGARSRRAIRHLA